MAGSAGCLVGWVVGKGRIFWIPAIDIGVDRKDESVKPFHFFSVTSESTVCWGRDSTSAACGRPFFDCISDAAGAN